MGAYVFDGVNDQAINVGGLVITAYPFTIGIVYMVPTSGAGGLGGLFSSAADTGYQYLDYTGGNDVAYRASDAGASVAAVSAGAGTDNTWETGIGSGRSATSRDVYRDGTNKASSTTNRPFNAGINTIAVGQVADLTPDNPFQGWIAYLFIWDIDLSDAEAAQFHAGTMPQVSNLVHGYDFTTNQGGTITDTIGSADLTVTGATFDAGVTPSPTFSSGSIFSDSGTAILALTPSSTEAHVSSDSGTANLTFTPSGTEYPTLTLPLTVDFEEGADGNPVPLSSGSPDFSNIMGAPEYSSLGNPDGGAISGFIPATPVSFFEWFNITTPNKVRYKAVIQHDFSNIGEYVEIMNLRSISGGAEFLVCLFADSVVTLSIIQSNGGSQVDDGVVTIPADQWFRIECQFDFSTNVVTVELYLDDASVIPDEVLTLTNSAHDLTGQHVFFGQTGDFMPGDLYFDSLTYEEWLPLTDAATVTLTLTPSAVEARTSSDSATALLTFTPSGTEFLTSGGTAYTDADTALLALTPSSTDLTVHADADTVPLALTPSGIDTQSGTLTDAGTGLLTFTPSAAEVLVAVDSATASVTFTPSGVEQRTSFDTATVPLAFTITGSDILAAKEADTPVVVLTPSGTDVHTTSAATDAATVYLFLVPSLVTEIYYAYDTLLVATMSRTWSATLNDQRWSGSATRRWDGELDGARRFSGQLGVRTWAGSAIRKWNGILGRS